MQPLFTITIMTCASVAQDFRWTDKVRVKREIDPDPDPVMGVIASELKELIYAGVVKPAAPWQLTDKGTIQQYTTPNKTIRVTLETALNSCRDLGGRVWDQDPQEASSFSGIEYGHDYWILSNDGSMAEYTLDDPPEVLGDSICTQVNVKAPAEGIKQEIKVKTVFEGDDGCEHNLGRTLCLSPVKPYAYANYPDYRQDQEDAKTIIQPEEIGTRLQEIERDLAETSFLTNKAKPKIIAKLKIIRTNINNIKEEDGKPFPNFKKALHSWKELITQIQDIEGEATKIIQGEQIREVKDQIEINNGIRLQAEQRWNRKWSEVTRRITDNENSMNNIVHPTRTTTRDTSVTEEQTKEEEEDEEGEETEETVTGYLKTIIEKLKTKQQQYSVFCSTWKLDCRAIAVASLIMTAATGLVIIAIITLIATMYDLKKQVNANSRRLDRVYDYMDLRPTKKEQEEDDNDWKHKIIIPNKTFELFTPNPTRNRAQMIQNYEKLNKKMNETTNALEEQGIRTADIKISHPDKERGLGRDQDAGVTSPFLG